MEPEYSQVREPLEVFAIDGKMNRATGSIPYRSLRWVRRYTKPGEFEMVVPADIYDPSWAYIDAWDRPELGIVQKVEFNDSSTVYGGIDSVTVSGFFLESVLNNIVFLDESPEEQKIYVRAPVRPTFSHSKQDTKVYADPVGGLYYENSSGDVVAVDDGRVVSTEGLSEVDYRNAFGSMWGNPDYGVCSFDYYYTNDHTQIVTVPYMGDDHGQPGVTYDVEFEDDKGNVFYYNQYGTLTQAVGVVEKYEDTYQVRMRRWDALADDEYGSYYTVTVKGPWQRTDAMEPITEGDSIDIVFRWARRMMGDWLLYAEPTISGVVKKVDPSFQYLGDLLYSTLYEVGASVRLEYLFEKNVNILSVYRGADRSHDQGDETIVVPDPVLPDGYTQLDYIQSSGTQYIDTGFTGGSTTRAVVDCQVMSTTGGFQGIVTSRQSVSMTSNFSLWAMSTTGNFRDDYGANDKVQFTAASTRHTFDKNGNTLSVDGVVVASHPSAAFQCVTQLRLFAGNTGGALGEPSNLRMWSCKIYEDGEMVRNLYPCRRDSDGAIGMYDTVGGAFYGNSGTGAFAAGPESEIPSHTETVTGNPWAVFSDTWGTISGYSASQDESNYRNTCYVLYDYDAPTEWDENGLPVVHSELKTEFDAGGYSTITGARAWINKESRRGYNTERVGDGDEPAIETYLDMRSEKPSADNAWNHEVVEVSGTDDSCLAEAEKQVFDPEEWSGDMEAVYTAYEQSTHDRGVQHLKENYGVVTNLDTGTVNARDYLKTFDLGDKVDFAVSTVGLQTTGRIIEVEETYESGRADIRLTIGDEQLTTIKKAKLA